MNISKLTAAFFAGQTAQMQLLVAAKLMRMDMPANASAAQLVNAARENAERAVQLTTGDSIDQTV